MPRVALKVAYDGTRFHGSQRQPGLRTVEGDLLAALERVGAVEAPRAAGFQAAGRTDAGVSAAGNVFAFDTGFRVEALPRAVSAHLEDAWAWGAAQVPEGFRPRAARLRVYRYFLPADGLDAERVRDAAALFEGTHDFRAFCRLDPGQDPVRSIHRIAVREEGRFLALTFEAPSYLWNQIRRVVEAARRVALGELSPDAVRAALERPRGGEDFGLAPPEPLVLLDVRYGFPIPGDGAAARRAAVDLRARILARDTATARERAFLDGMGVPE